MIAVWQGREGLNAASDVGKARGQIVALTAEDIDVVPVLVKLDTPAVELDLVNPSLAGWRLLPQDGSRGHNERVRLQHAANVVAVLYIDKPEDRVLKATW